MDRRSIESLCTCAKEGHAPIPIKAGDFPALLDAGDRCLRSGDWVGASGYYRLYTDDAILKNEVCHKLLSMGSGESNPKTKLLSPEIVEQVTKEIPIIKAHLEKGYTRLCQAYFRMGTFEQALFEVDLLLKVRTNNWEAHSLKGVLLQLLGRYGEAANNFDKALKMDPIEEDVRHLSRARKDCFAALKQIEDPCNYKLADYFLSGRSMPAPLCAEYVGPIGVQRMGDLGRGLVVSPGDRAVKVGQILLVSHCLVGFQAKVRVEGPESNLSEESELVAELETHKEQALRKMTTLLHYKIQDSSRRSEQFALLDFKDSKPRNLPLPKDLHLFKMHDLGLQKPGLEHRFKGNFLQRISNVKDEESNKIRNVVSKNWMSHKVMAQSCEEDGSERETYEIKDYGLWLLPSFINHSCAPNCNQVWVGDALFIIASKTISAGEELTIAYFDVMHPVQVRQAVAECDFGFLCQCRRCKFEESLGDAYNKVQDIIISSTAKIHKSVNDFLDSCSCSSSSSNSSCDLTNSEKLACLKINPQESSSSSCYAKSVTSSTESAYLKMNPQIEEDLKVLGGQFNAEVLELGVPPDYNNQEWVERYMWMRTSIIHAMFANQALLTSEDKWSDEDEREFLRFGAFMTGFVAGGSDMSLELYFRLVKFTDDKFGIDSPESQASLESALLAYQAAFGLQKHDVLFALIRGRGNMDEVEAFYAWKTDDPSEAAPTVYEDLAEVRQVSVEDPKFW